IENIRALVRSLWQQNELAIVRGEFVHENCDFALGNPVSRLCWACGRDLDDKTFHIDVVYLPRLLGPERRNAHMSLEGIDGNQRRDIGAALVAELQACSFDPYVWKKPDVEFFQVYV